VLLLLRVVLGVGESVYLPGGMKIVSLLFDSRSRGLYSGLVNCGTRAGLALGAPLISWMIVNFAWRQTFCIIGLGSLVWVVPWLLAFPSRMPAPLPAATTPEQRHVPWRDRNLIGLCLGHIGFSYYWYLLVT
jgi:MFS family permease